MTSTDETPPADAMDDPRHVYRARARLAMADAERDFERSLGLTDPPRSPVRMMLDALAPARNGRGCPLVKDGTVQAHCPPWSPWPCDGEGQAPKEAT